MQTHQVRHPAVSLPASLPAPLRLPLFPLTFAHELKPADFENPDASLLSWPEMMERRCDGQPRQPQHTTTIPVRLAARGGFTAKISPL
jgi:hypothetical protein